MNAKIKHAMRSLTPTQAVIVATIFVGSVILAGLALWGFTYWNRRQAHV